MGTAQVHDTTVMERRKRAGVVECDVCGCLVPQDAFCSACGVVWSMQGLVDLLVGMGAMKAPVQGGEVRQ
jgi:hypothetical protein